MGAAVGLDDAARDGTVDGEVAGDGLGQRTGGKPPRPGISKQRLVAVSLLATIIPVHLSNTAARSGSVVRALMTDDRPPSSCFGRGDMADHYMMVAPLLLTFERAADPSRSTVDHRTKRSQMVRDA